MRRISLNRSLISKSMAASVAASLSASLLAGPVRADTDNPISTGATIVLGSTLLIGQMTGNAFTSSSAGTTAASAMEKQALAASAIEDAAVFYSTGSLTGILPSAVDRIREMVPEAVYYSDAQIVDAIAQSAEELLSGVAGE